MSTSRPARPRAPARVGSLRAAVRMMNDLDRATVDAADRVAKQRRLVAELCRMLDPQPRSSSVAIGRYPGNGNGRVSRGVDGNGHGVPAARLSPRMRQTLDRLLAGDSEKEVAARFGRSRHTVHAYVKKLYERYGVSSRGELFALFVRAPAPASVSRPARAAAPRAAVT